MTFLGYLMVKKYDMERLTKISQRSFLSEFRE